MGDMFVSFFGAGIWAVIKAVLLLVLAFIAAAVIVLWVGLFIARLVREILTPVFARIKVNRLQEMAGIEAEGSAKLSNTLAYIVYVLILIPVIITTLQVLDIQAVSGPAIGMLDTMFGFIPNILAALAVIVVGCMAAKLSGISWKA